MVEPAYCPERGDIVWLQFGPQAGHEPAGRRPALVISPGAYNSKVGLAIMCPITSKAKGYPFEVQLPPNLNVSGVVLADQVKNLDWRVRKAEFLCKAPGKVIAEVLAKIQVLIT
ncbi:MAG TPA: endoribonuclease MazF [Bacillota bacterium]|nr:endoribonuclease MazF [Bacillota bacterium]